MRAGRSILYQINIYLAATHIRDLSLVGNLATLGICVKWKEAIIWFVAFLFNLGYDSAAGPRTSSDISFSL